MNTNKVQAVLSVVVWFHVLSVSISCLNALYSLRSFMVVWEEALHPSGKLLSCLVSNIAFGFGCSYFSHFEETGVGAQWSNIGVRRQWSTVQG